ncbi:MAG: hypothetical protein ACR2M4_05590 [Actinomycetota bacterium]
MAKAGARKDPVIRAQISALLEKGMSAREIAAELDYSVQRIHVLVRELRTQDTREKQTA